MMYYLKRRIRVIGVSLVVIVLLLAVFVTEYSRYDARYGNNRQFQLLAIPTRPLILDNINNCYYRVHGADYPALQVYDSDKHMLSNVGLNENEFRFVESSFLRIISDSLFAIEFLPDGDDMARKMARYTDNLAIHDYLYRMFLGVIIKYRRVPEEAKINKSFFESCRLLEDQVFVNIWYRSSYLRGKIITNPFFVESTDRPTKYNYLYYDNVSNKRYLLESLPYEEMDYGLYYYPSVLLDDSIISMDNVELIISNSYGSLYKIPDNHDLIYKEFFSYLPERNSFYKCVSSFSYNNTEQPVVSYLGDTEHLNTLVIEYYNRLKAGQETQGY